MEVELSIKQKLSKFPVPDFVWTEYHLDQEINDRGILLDMDVVENAIAFDEKSKSALMLAMQNITNLDNPNSVVQMKQWLSENGVEMETLGKKDVAKLIKSPDSYENDDITEALKLRLQLAKSSVKKYQAMQNAVCKDGRTHGMFQFYGANRSGRWAGRLIQLQNLPQNHMSDLAEARELVRTGDYDTMHLLYDDIPDTLSQLIRTTFIARPGYKVENIVQAISRDLLCYAMHNLSNWQICGHVHDELIIECPEDTDMNRICSVMGKSPAWMAGILIRGDGYETKFYKKD